VGTEFDAVTAVDADHGLVRGFIPKDGADEAGILTVPATYAFSCIEANTTVFSWLQSIRWTDFSAGRIITGPADNDGKTPLHPSDGSHGNTGLGKTGLILPARAREHATLAAYTSFCFKHRKSH
jgi:hypothetical protein